MSAIEGSHRVVGMRFALWAMGRRTPFDYTDVMAHFSVTRATAYRLMADWERVSGAIRISGVPPHYRSSLAPLPVHGGVHAGGAT